MGRIDAGVKERGIELPALPVPAANHAGAVPAGNRLFPAGP